LKITQEFRRASVGMMFKGVVVIVDFMKVFLTMSLLVAEGMA
jgi:hypothetical protein